jgi:radical SAM protein with 4Fe4S-binding SPASM domain
LEVTNHCNLNCLFCRAEANKHLENELKFSEITELLKDLKDLGAKHISITGGEPLMRKDLKDIVQTIMALGFESSISTNGTLISPSNIDWLKKLKLVRISLDSADPAKHDAIRGGIKGAFYKTLTNIKLLLENKINVAIRFTLIPQNINELPQIIELVHDLGMQSLSLSRGIPILGGKKFEMLSPKEYADALRHSLELGQRYGIEITSEDPVTFYIFKKDLVDNNTGNLFGGCAAGISYIHINSRGDVFPCPYLPIKVGSIKEEKIGDLIKNQKVTEKFYNIRFNLEGKCKSCKYLNVCGGCRASALSFTGNIQGSDPVCLLGS